MWQKLDFRYGASVKDILNVIDSAQDQSVFVLFLHSFNFLHTIYNFNKGKFCDISVASSLVEDYEYLLSEIYKREDCIFSKLDDCTEEVIGNQYIVNRGFSFLSAIRRKFQRTSFV